MKVKRILSLLLSFVMILGLMTTPALAETFDTIDEVINIENPDIADRLGASPPNAAITVPADATVSIGLRSDNYYKLSNIFEESADPLDGKKTFYYTLDDNKVYNYRVTSENSDYITYGGTFKKTPDFSLTITEEQLKPTGKTKTTIDRDTSSNNGYNVADIYLNINSEGYLKLAKDDTYQIISHRNWQAVGNTSQNYFTEPDKHYSVIDINGNPTDIVTVDDCGLLTANKSGTAIVLVTYDAMVLNYLNNKPGDDFYGAIYPENTGVFVVSVDSENSGIDTGMVINNGKNASVTKPIKLNGDALDSELDCIYYTGDKGSYNFTPVTADVSVSVANPVVNDTLSYNGYNDVAKNADGSFSVPLTTGRNIVKLEKDGKTEYQVITAKKVNVTVNSGEEVYKGDTVTVAFDKLYHPVNKFAGIYNYNAYPIYTNVSGFADKIFGSTGAQYNFASSQAAQTMSSFVKEKDNWGVIGYEKDTDLTIPDDFEGDKITLSGGLIYVSGYGFSFGDHLEDHRSVTYTDGVPTKRDYYADTLSGYFAKLPDIEIPVKTLPEISKITLNTENVKTEYFAGQSFDKTNLTVTATYGDNIEKPATNYTVTPEVLTADTTKVTVSYKGKTADIPVTVTVPKVESIEITTPPTTTTYKEGDTFDPTGMVISKVYEGGNKEETKEYTYSPNRELTTEDTAMTISYTGDDAKDTIATLSQPITVSEKTSSGGTSTSSKIKVSFTLLGDEKHGKPTGSDDTHTKKKGNLEKWIPKTTITAEKGSYVIDVLSKALSLNGIPYTNAGNYISEIRGLSELDNGELSGWMYTLNGKYSNKGVEEQKLSDGDSIIFHYTDDYTKETTTTFPDDSGNSSKPSNGSSNKNNGTSSNKKDDVTETETQKPTFTAATYGDVNPGDWFYDSVKYAYENSLMEGTDSGFEPESKMTRAMLVTVLWRMEDKPVTDFEMPFTDVEADQWYTEAIRWAASEKLISGVSETLFGTDDEITREQLATILYRYAQFKELDTTFDKNIALDNFADGNAVSDYAVSAIEWAVNKGIVQGSTDNTLAPASSATRAEVATMLMRFYEVIK